MVRGDTTHSHDDKTHNGTSTRHGMGRHAERYIYHHHITTEIEHRDQSCSVDRDQGPSLDPSTPLLAFSNPSPLLSLLSCFRAAGASWIQVLDSSGLRERYGWGQWGEGSHGATGTHSEGWFDPWALLQGLRRYEDIHRGGLSEGWSHL